MAKKRVYELAKDLGLSNKEMVDWLKAHEYDVKSHSSSLEDDQALAVTEKFRGERSPKAAGPKPPASGVVDFGMSSHRIWKPNWNSCLPLTLVALSWSVA